jgi:putative cardiolipin synthase
MRRLKFLDVAACVFLVAAVGGCALPPVRAAFDVSESLPKAAYGRLYEVNRLVSQQLGAGESASWLLDRADYSFDARLALVDQATVSLDIQYFIWETDPSSRLFAERIIQAADRGVRVRILLDDLTLIGQDGEYFGLALHPNIDLRTFNPWRLRSGVGRVGEFFVRFPQLNHRMHNKILAADGLFAIVGGRNIGDRYFGLYDKFVQNDLDIMVAGPALTEISTSFDLYWNSVESFPLEAIIRPKSAASSHQATREFISEFNRDSRDRLGVFLAKTHTWDMFFDDLLVSFSAGPVEYYYDSPRIAEADPAQLILPLYEFIGRAEERVVISSPYMIPDQEFMELLERLIGRGVEVVILTNSLGSNNHTVAHAAYERWRRPLLRLGVVLFEARKDSAAIGFYTTPPGMPGFLGLHTRGIVVDGRYCYIGSANIDPRSLVLNTELGLFVDSEELASRLLALIERDMGPDAAWRVSLAGRRKLSWESSAGAVTRQPASGLLKRFKKFFVGILPFRNQA